MKTVKDFIAALQKFNVDMPIVYRKAEEGGAFSDWQLHEPTELYPGGAIVVSAFQPIEMQSEKAHN